MSWFTEPTEKEPAGPESRAVATRSKCVTNFRINTTPEQVRRTGERQGFD